jgi:hypothetical protein
LETLFQARGRARVRGAAPKPQPPEESQAGTRSKPAATIDSNPAGPTSPAQADQDALSRLRAAKKRAGRGKPPV